MHGFFYSGVQLAFPKNKETVFQNLGKLLSKITSKSLERLSNKQEPTLDSW